MHWEMLLAVEIALTVVAVWFERYSCVCTLVAVARTAVVVLASIAGCK
jgi:hypothetical protein